MLINSHESRTQGVIFSGFWRYKPSHGGLGAVLLCAAGILMARLLLIFFQDDVIPPEKVQQAVVLGIAAFAMFYFGSMLLFSLITGYSVRLTVSDEGVRYGTKYVPWSRIEWIDARLRGVNLQVVLRRRSGLWKTRWLAIDEGLSEEQWTRLLKALCERVLPRFPHVRAGDVTYEATAQAAVPPSTSEAASPPAKAAP
jgi:hypothetical protein